MRQLRRGMRTVVDRLRGQQPDGRPRDVDGEAPAGWYDDLYNGSETCKWHYRTSHYYFLWCLIADRLRRAGWPPVLEVGCGPGQLANLLIDQGLTEYAGFDFSPVAVGIAKRNLPGREVWQGDARDPENYARFPHRVIVCTEVLEHIEEDFKIILSARPGTLFIATVPNFDYPSHVRIFPDAASVMDRYSPYLSDLEVTSWPSPRGDESTRFHLLTGVRVS